MLFSYKWLKEYISFSLSPRELAERLTMAGVEVDSVEEGPSGIKGVITAEILSIKRHPNADRLVVCEVKDGDGVRSIVCGARNMKEGDRVALALPGAMLPGGVKIKRSKIRGVVSEGMLCSEVELGISEQSDGIMILPGDTPLGVDIEEVIGRDSLIEISVTPNRGDLLSIKGLAREIGAVVGVEWRDKRIELVEEGGDVDSLVDVGIEAKDLCRRYTARVIEGVRVGPSDGFIKRRLEACGIRSINNVVDVTNYVMLETGQPLHAFDLDKIVKGRIVVRRAGDGETIETIDGVERRLKGDMLVIADSERAIAVAGIMGGRDTEVDDGTVKILLESAWFEPSSVRRTSRALNLSTDSSYRFERCVDIEGVPVALEMATSMILRTAGGRVARGMKDVYPVRYTPPEIPLRKERVEKILGTGLEMDEIKGILRRLNISVREDGERRDRIVAVPPSYRHDITQEIDLVEEVARLKGYDKVPATLPTTRLRPKDRTRELDVRDRIREVLVGLGFLEVINYSFVSREMFSLTATPEGEGVTILNPLAEDQVVMRGSLLPSLLENLRWNLSRRNEDIRVFEIAPVFMPRDGGRLPEERWKVSGLMYGMRWGKRWNYPREFVDFYDVKGVVESILEGLSLQADIRYRPVEDGFFHPGKSALVVINSREAGRLGEVHPELRGRFKLRHPPLVFELDIPCIVDIYGGKRRYNLISRYPESTRDIAFIVDDGIPYEQIITSIRSLDAKLIEKVELFDVYYGGTIPEGKRSLAIRITYRCKDRTLTHQEVERIHGEVIKELKGRFGCEIRGEERVLK